VAPRNTYRQIADDLRRRVGSGEFAPGTMVPSELSLVEHHGVPRGKVRSALTLLVDEGLIEVVPGQVRRVVGDPTRIEPNTAYEHVLMSLRHRFVPDVWNWELDGVGLAADDLAVHAERLIRGRRATRAFRPTPVPEETLQLISDWPGPRPRTPTRSPGRSRWSVVRHATSSRRPERRLRLQRGHLLLGAPAPAGGSRGCVVRRARYRPR